MAARFQETPSPHYGADPSSVTSYFISTHTQATQACWKWITYLTAQPEAVLAAPVRRSLLQSTAYSQGVGVEGAAVYAASLNAGASASFQALRDRDWLMVGIVLWFTRVYGQVISGEMTAEKALKAAQRTFDGDRACIIVRNGVSDEAVWQACLIEADPSLADLLLGR